MPVTCIRQFTILCCPLSWRYDAHTYEHKTNFSSLKEIPLRGKVPETYIFRKQCSTLDFRFLLLSFETVKLIQCFFHSLKQLFLKSFCFILLYLKTNLPPGKQRQIKFLRWFNVIFSFLSPAKLKQLVLELFCKQ